MSIPQERCNDWITAGDLTGRDCWPEALVDPDVIAAIIDAASDWLHQVTGGKWTGECTVGAWRPAAPHPTGSFGTGGCGACGASTVELPYGPIRTVTAVWEGTTQLVEGTDYRIIQPNRLVRMGGRGWPPCNDPTIPPGEDRRESWWIGYTWGNDIPALGVEAAAALACEFGRLYQTGKCALPAGTVQATGLGLTVRLDPAEAGKSIPVVGAFLTAYPQGGIAQVRNMRRRGFHDTAP